MDERLILLLERIADASHGLQVQVLSGATASQPTLAGYTASWTVDAARPSVIYRDR